MYNSARCEIQHRFETKEVSSYDTYINHRRFLPDSRNGSVLSMSLEKCTKTKMWRRVNDVACADVIAGMASVWCALWVSSFDIDYFFVYCYCCIYMKK